MIIFGALVVLRGLPPILAAADLGSALVVLALMVTAAVAGQASYASPLRTAAHGRRDAAPTTVDGPMLAHCDPRAAGGQTPPLRPG